MNVERVLDEAKLRSLFAQSLVHAESVYAVNKRAIVLFGLKNDAEGGLETVEQMLVRLENWKASLVVLQRKVQHSVKRMSKLS